MQFSARALSVSFNNKSEYVLRYSNEEMEKALAEINRNQKPVLAFFASLVGAVPAIAMYFFFAQMGGVLYLMLALPPAFVGLFGRFVGRTYKIKHRVSVGIVGAFVHIIGCLLLQFNPLIYLLTPVAFLIAMSVAKIKLERIHSLAILQADLGKLNANK
jgi:VIT1/CCC1 family predicted Fe2+/Mn2+ transporter